VIFFLDIQGVCFDGENFFCLFIYLFFDENLIAAVVHAVALLSGDGLDEQ
jgi:hypothetical protein